MTAIFAHSSTCCFNLRLYSQKCKCAVPTYRPPLGLGSGAQVKYIIGEVNFADVAQTPMTDNTFPNLVKAADDEKRF
ncbi:MAG: hypothetical protein L3J37_11725 [Rhodobacteraceae bacterium]|nr:hypothetical protein [Paracoccaceae bacterium]